MLPVKTFSTCDGADELDLFHICRSMTRCIQNEIAHSRDCANRQHLAVSCYLAGKGTLVSGQDKTTRVDSLEGARELGSYAAWQWAPVKVTSPHMV